MTTTTKASVQTIITDALDVIDAANVPGDLRAVALGKAIELLSGGSPARPRDSISSGGNDDDATPLDGDERLAKIAKRMSVEPSKLLYIYDLEDDGATLIVPRSKLGADKNTATREVAILYTAARQAGGYDDSHTAATAIRERVTDMGVLSSNNFATTLAGMKDVFAMKGSGQKREFKLTQHGYEEGGKLVTRLTDRD